MNPIDGLRNLRHPAWHVYDEYRSSRLTIKYYCELFERLRRRNLALEWVLALTASGSAVASLTLWQASWGKTTWQVLSVLVASLAVAKPLLAYDARIRHLQELVAGHRVLEQRLKRLIIMIEQRRRYDAALQQAFAAILDDTGSLAAKALAEPINETLRVACREAVERELPAESFFIPQESEHDETPKPIST